MNILSLDTATRTGWASRFSFGREPKLECGIIDCTVRTKATKTIPADHPGERFYRFENGVTNLFEQNRPDLVVYESVVGGAHAGGRTSLVQKGLEAVVLKVCRCASWPELYDSNNCVENTPVWSFSAATIKKFATGSGQLGEVGKEKMIRAARRAWPHLKVTDDNVADALWILALAEAVVKELALNVDTLRRTSPTPDSLLRAAHSVTLRKWPAKSPKRS